MAEEHPMTVFVAENQKVADAVVSLLEGAGIPAEVHVPPIDASAEAITGLSDVGTKSAELEVRVTNEAKLADAKDLINSALGTSALRAVREKRAARSGTVTATCEECGKPSEWPATAMGTTETCPHCGAYMDIPDPDDNWSDVDFGEAEEDEEGAKE
jgi:hypothetical protein